MKELSFIAGVAVVLGVGMAVTTLSVIVTP
jgi:hypothetical protein